MTENELRKIFSANVREHRNKFRWTQVELSKKSGVSVNFINNIESGKKWASAATVLKLANAFNIEVYELYMPHDSFPDTFDSVLRKYTDNIQSAIDEARLDFMLQYKARRT